MTERMNMLRIETPTIKETDPKTAFDARFDLFPNDRERLRTRFEELKREEKEQGAAVYLGANLKVLGEEISFADDEWTAIREESRGYDNPEELRTFLTPAHMKILSESEKVLTPLRKEMINDLLHEIIVLRSKPQSNAEPFTLAKVAYAKIISPAQFPPERVADIDWHGPEGVDKWLTKYFMRFDVASAVNLASLLANMRIIDPQRVPNFTSMWPRFRDALFTVRRDLKKPEEPLRIQTFASFAANLQILGAEKVIVPPEGGLRLVMPVRKGDIADTVQEMPQQLNVWPNG